MSQLADMLLRLAVWAALVEFLTLRLGLRLGAVLPEQEALAPVYRLIETLGLASLNLAVLASAGLLALAAVGTNWRRLGGALTGAALLGALVANLGVGRLPQTIPAEQVLIAHAGVTMAAIVAIVASARPMAHGRAVFVLVALAQSFAAYHALREGAAGLGLNFPGERLPAFLAEGLAVAAALALPWSFPVRPRRREVALGIGLALVLAVAAVTRPWTVATMTMWTVSFSLFLPGPVYGLALGVAVASFLALRRAPGGAGPAAGLLLVALAGLKLDFTYYALLALAGLLATSGSTAGASLPWVPTGRPLAEPEGLPVPTWTSPARLRGVEHSP